METKTQPTKEFSTFKPAKKLLTKKTRAVIDLHTKLIYNSTYEFAKQNNLD